MHTAWMALTDSFHLEKNRLHMRSATRMWRKKDKESTVLQNEKSYDRK